MPIRYHTGTSRGLIGAEVQPGGAGTPRGVIPAMTMVDQNGLALDGNTYTLASNQPLAATSGTTPVAGLQGGSYLWDAQFTGTSIVLQALGADGTTWRDVATRTTSGTTGVVIGQGATVRLYNPNGTGLTTVSSNLT